MLMFFIFVIGLSILLSVFSKQEPSFDKFLEEKNHTFSSSTSIWKTLLYSNYYYSPAYMNGIVDFLVLVICIRLILSHEEEIRVAKIQMDMGDIVRVVPKHELTAPGNPFREQIIIKNNHKR